MTVGKDLDSTCPTREGSATSITARPRSRSPCTVRFDNWTDAWNHLAHCLECNPHWAKKIQIKKPTREKDLSYAEYLKWRASA